MELVLLSLFVLLSPQPSEPDEGWISLFNGTDLSGWRANVAPDSFSVDEGILRAHCTSETARSHLFYVGDREEDFIRFKDFELKATVRGEPNSNSGIFFHTDYSTRDQRLHLARGYEVQLNSSAREERKTGSLYAIVDVLETRVDDSQWFELHITVQGKRIVVKINGEKVIDYTEPEDPDRPPNRKERLLSPIGGAIALQAHDPDSIWYFKDIKVRRLSD